MKQNRALWADILRILSMFFVVFIHVSPLPSVKSCIALFFMISGALLLGKEEAYTTFFQKRFFKVIFPWIFWTVIYTVIQGMIDCKTVRTIPQWKHLFELTLFTRFWILPVLVGLYLVTPLLRIIMYCLFLLSFSLSSQHFTTVRRFRLAFQQEYFPRS
jgi:surface polysaccharide O-acyltransferase-like enzyme